MKLPLQAQHQPRAHKNGQLEKGHVTSEAHAGRSDQLTDNVRELKADLFKLNKVICVTQNKAWNGSVWDILIVQ